MQAPPAGHLFKYAWQVPYLPPIDPSAHLYMHLDSKQPEGSQTFPLPRLQTFTANPPPPTSTPAQWASARAAPAGHPSKQPETSHTSP
eukprot:335927-Chlamydomonas_euryale.AAC.2